ncbi:MAG: sigma-70 family RNA polymerase sigma factor [Planctomycetia bacterium]|nr:sigma-70 family RNA polymerase sigma factor [Planctomycetia bacterium]
MRQADFLNQLRRLFFAERHGQSSDAELLERFCRQQDEDAFTALAERHGPAVWHVCRRMLRDEHLAEDVFQATFLVLARRAVTIRRPDALVGWLHGVATRLALKARLRESKRPLASGPGAEPAAPDFVEEMTVRELRTVLDEELLHLPDKYRYPLVLCYLEGKTRDEAAQQLDCPLETLKSRLERGRELLHARLTKRQVSLPAAFLSLLVADAAAQSAPRAVFVVGTAQAIVRATGGVVAGEVLSRGAQELAQQCLAGMKVASIKAAVSATLLVTALLLTGLWLQQWWAASGNLPPPSTASADVFDGPPAPFAPRLRADLPAADGPLRRLTVEERVGAARTGELVRVPLFFHEGECRDAHGLQLFAAADRERRQPIAFQPDDIRRAEDGGISRMHLYFPVNLRPWERQEFVLVRGENPGKQLTALPLKQENGRVTLTGNDLQLSFWTEGPYTGSIAGLQTTLGNVSLPDGCLGPRLSLRRQRADLSVARTSELSYDEPEQIEVRDLRFGAGPLFAKLVVRIGPKGLPDNAEFTYLVPRAGHMFVQTERLFPDAMEPGEVVGASVNDLLAGKLVLGHTASEQRVVQVPAGVRHLTRTSQGQFHATLVNGKSGLSLLPIPYVQSGTRGIDLGPAGEVAVHGASDFQRTAGARSQDLRAFWGQVRYVFSQAVNEDDLWEASRPHMQPLTAVVDEPGIATVDLHQRLKTLMGQFPRLHSRSWMQEAGRLYTLDDAAELKKLLTDNNKAADEQTESWLNAANQARAELTQGGTVPLQQGDKGRGSGPLDPWNLSYGASPLFGLAALGEPSARLDRICLAIGRAQRQFNGRVDANGFPYIDCFNTAFNHQVGSILAGMHGARRADDRDLLAYYRDCARSAALLDLGRQGFRAYPAFPDSPGVTDLHYLNTCDFYLRIIELACNEDLWLHPVAFGRYADCVDVNADLCHRTEGAVNQVPSSYRANFFRAQTHDQSWEAWSPGPYLGLLSRASDRGSVGLTEACFHAQQQVGRSLNWVEITPLFHIDLALREGLRRYRPETAPALPTEMRVERQANRNLVRWTAANAPDVRGYRIYRAERPGGPWTLLNSPYTREAAALVQDVRFTDVGGQPQQVYWITAVDGRGRESRWFPDEPVPVND